MPPSVYGRCMNMKLHRILVLFRILGCQTHWSQQESYSQPCICRLKCELFSHVRQAFLMEITVRTKLQPGEVEKDQTEEDSMIHPSKTTRLSEESMAKLCEIISQFFMELSGGSTKGPAGFTDHSHLGSTWVDFGKNNLVRNNELRAMASAA